jgi:protoporphyrinogen/coproporphyrinogen III oxidase
MIHRKSIAVVGAGISGLCTAYWLSRCGFDVTIFEKSDRVGGSIISENVNGYLIDFGPNSTMETSLTLKELIRELGIENQKVYGSKSASDRYVLKDDMLHPIPMSLKKLIGAKLFSTSAKLRLLREPFIKPTDGHDISIADFVRYRIGQEFLDYAINPFVAGVFAGNPERLSTPAAFPKLYDLEQKYGSFIGGAIRGARERKRRDERSKNNARLFSFINGMQTFPEALEGKLFHSILKKSKVEKILRKRENYIVRVKKNGRSSEYIFDRIVLSVPAYSLSKILSGLETDIVKSISEVEYQPVAVVFMGLRNEDLKKKINGFGFLVPEVENRRILGSIFSSCLFPNRAPDGHTAMTTFVGGSRKPEQVSLNDRQLQRIVLDELDTIIGLKKDPEVIKIHRWHMAIPQYNLGYQQVQKAFDKLERTFPGLYFSGNLQRGISIGDAVLCAQATARKIAKRHF